MCYVRASETLTSECAVTAIPKISRIEFKGGLPNTLFYNKLIAIPSTSEVVKPFAMATTTLSLPRG